MLTTQKLVAKRPFTLKRPVARRSATVRAANFEFISGVIVRRGLSLEEAKKEGFTQWPTWSSGVSKFPWSYSERETAYILEGKVTVTPDGGEEVELGVGDFVTFPAGMSCVWDVKEPIKKHYNFG